MRIFFIICLIASSNEAETVCSIKNQRLNHNPLTERVVERPVSKAFKTEQPFLALNEQFFLIGSKVVSSRNLHIGYYQFNKDGSNLSCERFFYPNGMWSEEYVGENAFFPSRTKIIHRVNGKVNIVNKDLDINLVLQNEEYERAIRTLTNTLKNGGTFRKKIEEVFLEKYCN